MPRLRYIAFVLAAALAGPALAEPPRLQRGLNVDLWIEWRSIGERLADPDYLDIYPDWRRVLTQDMFEIVAAQGFDFVRLPMDPGPLLAYGPGAAQTALVADMRAAAETALAAGLNVIVDMHPVPRGDETGGMEDIMGPLWPDYVVLVGLVAQKLDGLPPDRVILEPLNEPTNDCEAIYTGAPAFWPDMQAELHHVARKAAPDLALMLTGACWGGAAGLAALDPGLIDDENVLWSFHSYAPFTYTHQGASWDSAPLKHITGLPYPPTKMTPEIAATVEADATIRLLAEDPTGDVQAIAEMIADYMATPDSAVSEDIDRAVAWADAHSIPRNHLLLGEFGALHTTDGVAQPREWYHAFLTDKRRAAEAAGIGWAVLSHAGGMGVAIEGDPDRRLAPATCLALGLKPCSN